MTLHVVPEGLASTAAAVEAVTAQLAAAHTSAAAVTTAVVAPAADPVSLQNALALSAHGAQHNTVATAGVANLGRAGLGIGQSGLSYASGDADAATVYLLARGR